MTITFAKKNREIKYKNQDVRVIELETVCDLRRFYFDRNSKAGYTN